MFICAVGFAESLKRKNSEPTPERVPSPQPPPPIVEETAPIEAEGQDSGRETRKNKKRVKMAAKKKTPESETFEPLVPETRIVISALEEATLFTIQTTEEHLRPDLDRDISEIQADARDVVPMVRGNTLKKNEEEKVSTTPNV